MIFFGVDHDFLIAAGLRRVIFEEKVRVGGLEPPATCLKGRCSTD
jgi:hypothetical protein